MFKGTWGAAGLALTLTTVTAQAEPVSPTGKGIAGGALLGAEIVVVTESFVGLSNGWWYLLGGTLGAAGGGVGGYFVEQSAPTELSLYMLVGGMALVIPASISYLNATSYAPDLDGDNPNDVPSEVDVDAEFGKTVPTRLSPSLVQVEDGSLRLDVPDVQVSDVYTRAERLELGMQQQTQVLFPLLGGRF